MIDERRLESFGLLLKDEPMSRHTTYKIGGEADYFLEVSSLESLEELVAYLHAEGMPWMVLGNGSNVLVADEPYHGVIISLRGDFTSFRFQDNILEACAGCFLIAAANAARDHGLSGLEFASGIPGTLGGGIYMNAGAYRSDLSERLIDVTILDEQGVRTLPAEDLHFTYRHSDFQSHKNWIILSARLRLEYGDREDIQALMDSRKQRRLSSQPVSRPCAGSVFRNPDNLFAWKIVDALGFRGRRCGGAKVSEIHSNFIINENGHAKAADVDALIREIQKEAYEQYGIELITEVERINWDEQTKRRQTTNQNRSETEISSEYSCRQQ